MPWIDGVFYPKPFRPLEGSLFDVIPPGHPDEQESASRAEQEWYERLVITTAALLVYVVDHVRSNYVHRRGVSFNQPTVTGMMKIADRIGRLLDDDMDRKQISNHVNRLAKQFGLVVYSTEEGPRQNWPMASRAAFTHKEAMLIVHDAFWGRWPHDTRKEVRHDHTGQPGTVSAQG